MTSKSFDFWRHFSVGLGFSYSVGFAKPTDEEGEEEEGDSWHKVSNKYGGRRVMKLIKSRYQIL